MTFFSLPFLNILGKKGRSGALFVFSALLAFFVFGGSLLLRSLGTGLKSLEARLGADIIVVPYEARTKVNADTILNQGNRSYFYMPKSIEKEVSKIEGVEKVSSQIYFCSMNAGCCSISLQLIGFDPESDFTIQPWVRESFKGKLETGDLLVGSKVSLSGEKKLKFFNTLWNVQAQLEETGTGLDNAVFASLETIHMMMESAEKLSWTFTDKNYSDRKISTVMVKIKDGYDIDAAASLIQRKIRKIVAVKAKSMTSGIADSLADFSKIIAGLIITVSFLCLVILFVVMTLITGERKKEFAVFRVMGASQKKLSMLVMWESAAVNFAGGLAGIIFAAIVIIPFHGIIKQSLGLPFLLPPFFVILLYALVSLLISVLCGAIAASYSAFKISKADTALILREG